MDDVGCSFRAPGTSNGAIIASPTVSSMAILILKKISSLHQSKVDVGSSPGSTPSAEPQCKRDELSRSRLCQYPRPKTQELIRNSTLSGGVPHKNSFFIYPSKNIQVM